MPKHCHRPCAFSIALGTIILVSCAGPAAPLDDGLASRTAARASCSACSVTVGGHAFFGANLDYKDHCRGQLFINKRGVRKTGLIPSADGVYAEWVSKYASITFNFVGYQFAWAGMNEMGLTLSTMSLPQTVVSPPDHRPVVDSGLWMQYVLDTCATVEDVIAADQVVRNITVDHYLVADRTGASAAIEYLNGEMVVHTGGGLPVSVLTNSTYEQSVNQWLARRALGDYWRLNGSLQRFCIAADRVSAFEPASDEAAVAFAFDTLDTIAGERFSEHASQWSIVFDTSNLRASFRTYADPSIRYVDLQEFPLHCYDPIVMLDIDTPLAGAVGSAFFNYSHSQVRDHYRWFIDFWNTNLSTRWADSVIAHFESFDCMPRCRRRSSSAR